MDIKKTIIVCENSLICFTIIMKRYFKIALSFMLIVSIILTSCASSKKNQCGCPSKKGLVGY